MDEFKSLVDKTQEEGVEDFKKLLTSRKKAICQSYFNFTESADNAKIIMLRLFPGQEVYLTDRYTDSGLAEKACQVVDAFNLRISVNKTIGCGAD